MTTHPLASPISVLQYFCQVVSSHQILCGLADKAYHELSSNITFQSMSFLRVHDSCPEQCSQSTATFLAFLSIATFFGLYAVDNKLCRISNATFLAFVQLTAGCVVSKKPTCRHISYVQVHVQDPD